MSIVKALEPTSSKNGARFETLAWNGECLLQRNYKLPIYHLECAQDPSTQLLIQLQIDQ